MLQARYPLPIDVDVLYDDESHTYGLRSCPGKPFKSVTAVAGMRMPPFDAAAVSSKLAASGRGAYAGKSAKEIRESWSKLAALGTALHADVETYYNGGPQPNHNGFIDAASVLKIGLNLNPWRSELRMASATTGIAGTSDMIFTTNGEPPKNGVTIVDWKRTDKAPEWCRYDTCRRELSHLPAGKFWKFAVQLNLYALLLWDTCQIPTVKMLFVLLHPNGNEYNILKVPQMPEIAAVYRRARK